MKPYRPLSERTPLELRVQAEEYRGMAATARTMEAKTSLESLAVRFDALAEERERKIRDIREAGVTPRNETD